MKAFLRLWAVVCSTAGMVCITNGVAQPGATDLTFDPGSRTDGPVYTIAQQSDEKIIIGGGFNIVQHEVRRGIARLNANGSLDSNFVANAGTVYSVAVQSDGKIIIAGAFDSVNGVTRTNIARLNTDGSLDTNFLAGANSEVRSVAVQTNGQVLIGGFFTAVNGSPYKKFIARLNSDGSLDNFFEGGLSSGVYSLAVQSDGKVFIGGSFNTVDGATRRGIARLNYDGTRDSGFGTCGLGVDVGSTVHSVALDASGNVLIGGDFSTIDGATRNYLARLDAAGCLDTNFLAGLTGPSYVVQSVVAQTNGQVLIGGYFSSVNNVGQAQIAQLNSDGSLDTNFLANVDSSVQSAAVQSDGKILIGGYFTSVSGVTRYCIARLDENGSPDLGFGSAPSGIEGTVKSVAVQSDMKVLIGGTFTSINGVTRNNIARLNTDGSLDTNFCTGMSGADGAVYSVAVQTNGQVLIGGYFTSVNGSNRNYIARLNTDGTVDSGFLNGLGGANGGVRSLALQSDGKVLIGGDFTMVNGAMRNGIARLNPDGSRDTSFGAGLSGADSYITSVAAQNDGKVLIGGAFFTVNSFSRNRIARLNTDGTTDTNFLTGSSGANSVVESVASQTNGQVLIGGNFSSVNSVGRDQIARLNPDGSLDTNFLASADGTVVSVAIQTDGGFLIGGDFTSVNGTNRNRIARLNTNGSLDASFGSGLSGVSGTVYSVAIANDGKVVIGGSFTIVNNVARRNVARLYGDGPLLSIVRSGGNMNLYWPASWTGFAAQATAGLDMPWNDIPQRPVSDGTNWSVMVTVTNASEFYRLKK